MAEAQILIVEDDSIIALELEDRLRGLDYATCAVTPSGEEAIEKVAELRPDLVLMDIRLRGSMDGVEAAAEIRTRFDVPVVYLTAYADRKTLQRAKVTEPYGYIIKPFEERDLRAAIEVALYKHEMERRLKESEQWLATTLRSIGDAVVATDEEGHVVFMNGVAESLTGWNQASALGREAADILTLIAEETGVAVENPITKVLQDGLDIHLGEYLLLAKNGRHIPVDGSTALIRDDENGVRGVVWVFQDVSERLRAQREREDLQAQLFQAQRVEAIGVLVGGIAHDFNNLLTTIIGSSSLVLADLPARDPKYAKIERVKRAAERAASLTHQILALSRRQMPEPKILDLNATVLEMEEMLQRFVGEGIEIINALGPGYRYVRADPAQMEQVIMNLVVNAYEAMPQDGQVTIKTEIVTSDQDRGQPIPQAQPGTFVRLSVSDTGVGMDEETLQSIFEPFFSTKEKGTGLGLTIVRNIIEGCGGWVDVHSERERGSTFEAYLPACFAGLEYGPDRIAAEPDVHGKGERVLLVEDDEGVRAAVSEMLRVGGYVVVEAASAGEAMTAFEREEGNFHLVLSDVVLPDQDGLQLIDQLLVQKPELSVLLTSGYPDQRAQWTIIRERGIRFLRKPYGLAELLPVVREVLEGG
jgi:two-component system cell cycle sensor histidine kinase/response regulator CckA